jgi:hypothetical protein
MSRKASLNVCTGARAGASLAVLVCACFGEAVAGGSGAAPAIVCTKADFEAVVEGAAAALRDLNDTNKPAFQDKLRELKEKRGWSHDQFLNEAAPFVKDDKIDIWDDESSELLSRITQMGQEGSESKTPDCTLLAELKSQMSALVAAQSAKWAYMFQKLDNALSK